MKGGSPIPTANSPVKNKVQNGTTHSDPANTTMEDTRDSFAKHFNFLEMKQQMVVLQEQMKILLGLRMQPGPAQQPMGWGQSVTRQ